MVKLIGLVVSVGLTALLISSCSGGGTESGYEANLSRSGAMESGPATRSIASTLGLSRASQCDWTFSRGDKYLNLPLHKALAASSTNPNSGNGVWNSSTAAKARSLALANCESRLGSCTVVDVDEEQCHSGSGTYMVAAVGYTNKYADLLAAYNANSGGQSKSLWGKNHYCGSGKNEGRTYAGLSSATCSSSTTTTTTTSGDAFEGYVNKYGDLLAVYNASGGGQTKSAWGKNHYCNYGRVEGRNYSGLSAASCSSSTTTTTTTATSSAESCYGDYVRKYPDLLAAYNASGGGQNINAWGKSHYNNNGKAEGRSACSSTTTTTTTTSSWPSGNYQYLYDRNARSLSGHTIRWNSKTIQVSGAHGSWRAAVARWSSATTINLSYVNSPPSQGNGIEIIGRVSSLPSNVCGLASILWDSSGKLTSCKIRFNEQNIDGAGCRWTVEHEVGHCLGFFGHAADNGIMRSGSAGGTGQFTANTRGLINLLYSLAPGTDIRSKVSKLYRMRRDSRKYDPSGSKTYSMDMYAMRDGTIRIVEGD